MGTTSKTLYDTDFVEWAAHTAELLRKCRFEEVDLENLIEEVEDLARSRQHAVESQLRRMLKHLIKQRIEPKRDGRSWRGSMASAISEIETDIRHSPSLRRYLDAVLPEAYRAAIKEALFETGLDATHEKPTLPPICPFTMEELLNPDAPALLAKLR